jgi:hypothetical protein
MPKKSKGISEGSHTQKTSKKGQVPVGPDTGSGEKQTVGPGPKKGDIRDSPHLSSTRRGK